MLLLVTLLPMNITFSVYSIFQDMRNDFDLSNSANIELISWFGKIQFSYALLLRISTSHRPINRVKQSLPFNFWNRPILSLCKGNTSLKRLLTCYFYLTLIFFSVFCHLLRKTALLRALGFYKSIEASIIAEFFYWLRWRWLAAPPW